MELKDLASKIGAKAIIVEHINDMYYKDSFTVVINDDMVMNYVGKTYTFIPLTMNGVGKTLAKGNITKLIAAIKDELKNERF